MKRRLLGFTLGAVLGVGAAYAMRWWRNNQNPGSNLSAAVVEKPVAVETPAETNAPQRTKYSVRRTGPRPQGVIEAEADASTTNIKITRSTEPPAATETDEAAVSPRSETFEPDITQAEVEPAKTEVAPIAENTEAVQVEEKLEAKKASTNRSNRKKKDQSLADFLPINGIGEVFNQRLHENGITTYAALAAISSEELSQKIDVPQERIDRDKWQEQAARLAEEEAGKTSGEIDAATEETK